MRLTSVYEYPEIEQVTLDDGTRYYVSPSHEGKMYSVTTILDATADKQALLEWKARVGEVKARQISKQATDIGSLMHLHVECYIQGIERPSARTEFRMLAKDMADRIIENGLPHVDEVWGIESRLFVPGLYAGTTDIVGTFQSRPAVMDHKSAKKIRTRNQIKDYPDQLAAYAIAHDERYGTEIDTGVIFMSSRDGGFKLFEFSGDDFKRAKGSFIDRLNRFLDSVS